jgi:hypothetical protein
MLLQKEAITSPPAQQSRKQLEHLYARRMVIDSLIRSLQDYDRLRSRRINVDERKTA